MKSRFALLLLFALSASLITFAGPSDYTIKPPEGWTKRTNSSAPEHYSKNGVTFMLTIDSAPAEAKTLDAYVEFVKKQLASSFKKIQFEPVAKRTINGVDARELRYTAEVSGMKMKYDVVYVPKQTQVYTMTAGGMNPAFDAAKADCQAFFQSFKFK